MNIFLFMAPVLRCPRALAHALALPSLRSFSGGIRVLKLFEHCFDTIRCSVCIPLFVRFSFAFCLFLFLFQFLSPCLFCQCIYFYMSITIAIAIAIASIFRCGFLMFSFWLNIWYIHFVGVILHFVCVCGCIYDMLSLVCDFILLGCIMCLFAFCMYSFYSVAYKNANQHQPFVRAIISYHIISLVRSFHCVLKFPLLFFCMKCCTAAIFRGSQPIAPICLLAGCSHLSLSFSLHTNTHTEKHTRTV